MGVSHSSEGRANRLASGATMRIDQRVGAKKVLGEVCGFPHELRTHFLSGYFTCFAKLLCRDVGATKMVSRNACLGFEGSHSTGLKKLYRHRERSRPHGV